MAFRDLAGHRRVIRLLSRSVAAGSLPPSLIFAGPDGVGKRRVALAVAQALNCLALHRTDAADIPLDACGVCPVCRRIERGVHPDVWMVEPGETGAIKIEAVRDITDRASYRPFEGRRRVFIVDDADALMGPAQNALLKTLEEPPAGSVFILVTSRPDVLLPTVRSRCPRVRFGPLTASEVAGVLVDAHRYPEREARAAAAVAGGSVGRALRARSGELADVRDAAWQLLQGVAAARDPRRCLEVVTRNRKSSSSSGRERDELGGQLQALRSLLRDLEVLATRAPEAALVNVDLRSELELLSGSYGGERARRAFSAVDRALAALDRNASPKLVADWIALQL
jgi:DNA polymerase III subunit delta'